MSYYPFEAHVLRLVLRSYFSTDWIRLKLLDTDPEEVARVVPESWVLVEPFKCWLDTTTAKVYRARGGSSLQYDQIVCEATVSRVDMDWFFHDYFFFVCIILANLFACIGLPAITAPSNLARMLNTRSATCAAMCLAYAATLGNSYNPHNGDVSVILTRELRANLNSPPTFFYLQFAPD
jgi:hypothetical protein